MKKFIYLIVLWMISIPSFSQESHKAYCELIGTGNAYGITGKVAVRFGGKYATKVDKNTFIVDENNKCIQFASMIDAVTYLSQFGWELLNGYPVTETQGMIRVTAYHYILYKTIIPGEDVTKGIRTSNSNSSFSTEYNIQTVKEKLDNVDPNSSEYYELKELYKNLKKKEKEKAYQDDLYK